MTRTLHLHIGSHRTATTSIQSFLRHNLKALIEHGCLLPFRKPRHFDREDLFLEPLPDADASLAQLTTPQVSAELVTEFVAPLIRQMAADGQFSPSPKAAAKKG